MIVGSSIDFDVENDVSYQGNLEVKGNLYAQDLYMRVKISGDDHPSINIKGNVYMPGNLYAWGLDGISGVNINVGGDAFIGWVSIDGGDTLPEEEGHAGDGGEVNVK